MEIPYARYIEFIHYDRWYILRLKIRKLCASIDRHFRLPWCKKILTHTLSVLFVDLLPN